MRARVQTGGLWAGEKALPSEVPTRERAKKSVKGTKRELSFPSLPPNKVDDVQKEAALVTSSSPIPRRIVSPTPGSVRK